jgi:xanthine dehydrogenase accessory factor
MKIWPVIERALLAHGSCVMVSIVAAEGSVPREAGARMIVTPQGFHGTIGGGTLEWHALATAQSLLGKPAAVKIASQSLGPSLGQCCGGRVKLAFEAFDHSSMDKVKELAKREEEGPFILMDRIPGIPFTEAFGEEQRHILVFGAGHVGRALVLALAPLSFAITWSDPRPDAFPQAVPANAKLVSGDPLAVVEHAPHGSLAFVMSHSHALDLAIVDAALRNLNIAHTGLIGSATKRARFEKRLREANADHDRIAALICPIGIAGIASKAPAAIAAATVAQIIMLDEALESSNTVQPPLSAKSAG